MNKRQYKKKCKQIENKFARAVRKIANIKLNINQSQIKNQKIALSSVYGEFRKV